MSMILAVYVVNKQNSRANFYAGLLNFRRYSFPVNNDDKRQNPQKLLLHKGNKKYLKRTETENIYAVPLQPCPFQRFFRNEFRFSPLSAFQKVASFLVGCSQDAGKQVRHHQRCSGVTEKIMKTQVARL